MAAEKATDDDIAAETINSNHAWSAWRLTAPVQMTPGTPLVRLLLGRLSATGRHGKRILRPGGGQDWITRNESGSRLIVSARRPVLSPAQAEGEENDKPRHSYLTCHSCLRASRDRTHLMAFNEGNRILPAGGLKAKK